MFSLSSNSTSTLKHQSKSRSVQQFILVDIIFTFLLYPRKVAVILASIFAAAVACVIAVLLMWLYQKRQSQHTRQFHTFAPRPFPKDAFAPASGSGITEIIEVVGDPPPEPHPSSRAEDSSRHLQSPHYNAPFHVPPSPSHRRSARQHLRSTSSSALFPVPTQRTIAVITPSRSLPLLPRNYEADISPLNIPPPPYHAMSLWFHGIVVYHHR